MNDNNPKISAIVLTKNEEETLKRCLTSLKFADEIVVIDDCSEDATIRIAKKCNAKVYIRKLEEFSSQRNFGKNLARFEWILYLDADEEVPEILAKEIQDIIINTEFSAFKIQRFHHLMGGWMKHGGWQNDFPIRLIKRDQLVAWQGLIHESANISGKVGKLGNKINHYGHRDIYKGVKKTRLWGEIEARLMLAAGHPKITIFHLIKAITYEFTHRFIIQGGFLDGISGFMEATNQAFNKFFVLARLYELQQISS